MNQNHFTAVSNVQHRVVSNLISNDRAQDALYDVGNPVTSHIIRKNQDDNIRND